jgi:8-oxo-dGTP diphosphatase
MEEFDKSKRPKVGLGVYILNEKGQVLLTKRAGSHWAETWCPPGGHLEFGESFFACGKRETKEEVDLDISEAEVVGITNDVDLDAQKHYVTLHLKSSQWSGTPKIMEPEKCTEIGWFDLDKLPSPLALCNDNFFQGDFLCLCGSGQKFKDCCGKNNLKK